MTRHRARRSTSASGSELEPIGVVDIGSNSVRLVVYEGAVRSPTPIFNEKVLCGLGRQVGSTGRLGERERRARARGAEPLQGDRAHPRRQERRAPSPPPPAAMPRTARDFIARGERALRRPHPDPVRPARGRARRQRHHDGLPHARRHCRRPRRRQPGDHRGRRATALRQSVTLPLGGLRLLDASGGRIDEARRHRRRGDRHAWRGSTSGTQPRLLRGRRHLARHRPPAHGADRLPAARHARLHDADRGGDRLLRGDPQGQEAVRHARHRGDLPAAARGAALRRAGARAPAQEAASRREVHFSVFGIREGLVYSLLSERERRKDPLLSLLRRVRAPALAVRRARRRAVRLDGRPVRAARPQGDRGGAAPAACRLPALRHQLARAPGLPRRAEPDPDRPCRRSAASTTRAASSWRLPSTSAMRHRRRCRGAGRTSCPSG